MFNDVFGSLLYDFCILLKHCIKELGVTVRGQIIAAAVDARLRGGIKLIKRVEMKRARDGAPDRPLSGLMIEHI